MMERRHCLSYCSPRGASEVSAGKFGEKCTQLGAGQLIGPPTLPGHLHPVGLSASVPLCDFRRQAARVGEAAN